MDWVQKWTKEKPHCWIYCRNDSKDDGHSKIQKKILPLVSVSGKWFSNKLYCYLYDTTCAWSYSSSESSCQTSVTLPANEIGPCGMCFLCFSHSGLYLFSHSIFYLPVFPHLSFFFKRKYFVPLLPITTITYWCSHLLGTVPFFNLESDWKQSTSFSLPHWFSYSTFK